MFTHIVVLTLAESAEPTAADDIVAGLRALVGQVPGLLSARTGQDLGLAAGNATLIGILEFESEQAWRDYGTHPAHKALISEKIAPVLAGKAALQVAGFDEATA